MHKTRLVDLPRFHQVGQRHVHALGLNQVAVRGNAGLADYHAIGRRKEAAAVNVLPRGGSRKKRVWLICCKATSPYFSIASLRHSFIDVAMLLPLVRGRDAVENPAFPRKIVAVDARHQAIAEGLFQHVPHRVISVDPEQRKQHPAPSHEACLSSSLWPGQKRRRRGTYRRNTDSLHNCDW